MRKFLTTRLSRLAALYRQCIIYVTQHKTSLSNSLLVFLYGIAMHQRVQAGILSAGLCTAYNNVLDNQFIGVAAMGSLAGILLKWKFADKSGEAMTGVAKTGMAVSGLLSLPTVVSWFGATPC